MPNAPGQKAATPIPEGPRLVAPVVSETSRPAAERTTGEKAIREPSASSRMTRPTQSLGTLILVAALCLVVGAGAMIALMKLSGH